MSHELRTPLNAVIGYAELIEEEASQSPAAQDAGKIRSAARQLLSVIDVVLDLSKLESGLVALQRERVNAAAVLSQLREAAPALAAINNNTIEFREDGPLGEAEIDLLRVHQCLLQLVSNAAKFTRNGRIEVVARRLVDGRTLSFSVSDNGIGIPAEQQQRIFETFVQLDTDDARRYEGAGLGLALVRRLAQLMGGDVTCHSAPGQGAVFTLTIATA
jgi:signal transduction histidine kinase